MVSPGAIRTRVRSQANELRSYPCSTRGLLIVGRSPPTSAPKLGRVLLELNFEIRKMVTRVRFERTTPSFGGWCSIQLSYRATPGRSLGERRGGTYWIRTSDLCGVNTAL